MIELACALLAIGSFVFVFMPMRESEIAHGETKTRLTYLRERKDVVYDNLRDLNFEYKAGKFPEADYLAMRSAMENEAAGILAEIDDLASGRRR
jgi:hypothetical protein